MTLLAPGSLEEALELRRAYPEAVPVAGGTDLMVDVNAGRLVPPALLDLSHVDELRSWRRRDGVVSLGAGMTFARIERELTESPSLVEAARSVASTQIRARATVGGNLATASPAGDSLPVLAVYGADVVTASARAGTRRVPLDVFLVGPKRTSLEPDELIVGVEWRSPAGAGSFAKVGRRHAMIIATASVCLQAEREGHTVRLALGSVGPTVLRPARAEAFAADVDWGDPRALAEFGRLAAAEARPIDDRRGSAAYRRRAIEVLARRALEKAARC